MNENGQMTRQLLERLKDDPAVRAWKDGKEGIGNLALHEEALIAASAFSSSSRPVIIVKPTLFQAQNLYQRILGFRKEDVVLFGVEESLQVEAIASSPELEASRIEALYACVNAEKPLLVVTHLAGFLRYLPNPETFRKNVLTLREGDIISREMIMEKLRRMGYRRAGGVHTAKASRGESSFRGKGSAPGCIPKLVLPRPD